MALDKATLKSSLQTALEAFLTNVEAVADGKILAAFDHGLTFTDAADAAQARTEVADKIANALTTDVTAAGHPATLAQSMADAIDVFVKSGAVTSTVAPAVTCTAGGITSAGHTISGSVT